MATAPLVPPGCDLDGMNSVLIDVPKLFASEFNVASSSTPLAWMCGFKLWLRSSQQTPPGSLPPDDGALTYLAELGLDTKTWKRVRGLALRGWELATDGRLYHAKVAEVTIVAWIGRLNSEKRSGAGHAAKNNKPFDMDLVEARIAEAKRYLVWVREPKETRPETAPQGLPKAMPEAVLEAMPKAGFDVPESLPQACQVLEVISTEVRDRVSNPPLSKEDSVSQDREPASGRARKPSLSPTAAEMAAFDAFWSAYPRKVAKPPALAAFVALMRSGEDVTAMTIRAQAYAGERAGKDPQHTAHAATWLNQRRWEDEITPPPAGGYQDQSRARRGGVQGWSGVDQALEMMGEEGF